MLIKISPAVSLYPNHILITTDDAIAGVQEGLLRAQPSDCGAEILPVVGMDPGGCLLTAKRSFLVDAQNFGTLSGPLNRVAGRIPAVSEHPTRLHGQTQPFLALL